MSDDDRGRPSGPSNPWQTVPEVNQPSAIPDPTPRPELQPAPARESFDRQPFSAAHSDDGHGKVVYDDREGGLIGLAIKGYLLTMITLGIYRFWYLTNLRRFFWSHTSVHQSPLEYTGRGMEIFIGFLIALAVIVPLNLAPVYFAVGLGSGGQYVSFVLAPIYAILIFFAFYRSRRYRVNRTLWRGLRAHQTGSGWKYAFRALGWSLLGLFTLGLCTPQALTDLYRYRIERMYLGTVPFSFVGNWKMIAKPFWILWAIFVLPAGLMVGFSLLTTNLGEFIFELSKRGFDITSPDVPRWSGLGSWQVQVLPTVLSWLMLGILAVPYYYARRTSAFFSATQLHGVRCVSHLRARSMYAVYAMFLGVMVLALGMFTAIGAGLVTTLAGQANGSAAAVFGNYFWFLGGTIFSYVFLLVILGLSGLLIVQRGIWKRVAGSITILNPELLDELAGRMHDGEGGFGAGIADALDVGDFDVGL